MIWSDLSKQVGFDMPLTRPGYPSLKEATMLTEKALAGNEEAARQLIYLHRFMDSPQTGHEDEALCAVVAGITKLRRKLGVRV